MHVELLFLEGEFDRTFRMQPASLEKLLQKLAPSLLKSTPHNGTFGVEFVKPETVMMALRWLAGGNYDDIRLVAGCSVMSLFRLLWQVMFAIIANMSDFRRMLGATSSLALLQKPEFPMCTKTVFCVDEHLLRDPDLRITRAYIEPMPLPNPVRGKGYLPSDQSTRPTAVTIIPGASLKRWMIVHTLQ